MSKQNDIALHEMTSNDTLIQQLYHQLSQQRIISLCERVKYFSLLFIDTPYLSHAVGEGRGGLFDCNPIFRVDAFDCVTFVNTILALVRGVDVMTFCRAYLSLAYSDGIVSYQNRNHFMSTDWNRHNNTAGFIEDITRTICGKDKKKLATKAITVIDKAQWMLSKTNEDLYLPDHVNSIDRIERLQFLHELAGQFPEMMATIDYLSFEVLFDKSKQAISSIWAQFPECCVVEIVRPAWDLRDKIGTSIHVSHVGLAWRHAEGYYQFCHASQLNKKVEVVLLEDYLRQQLDSSTIKGINLQKIL